MSVSSLLASRAYADAASAPKQAGEAAAGLEARAGEGASFGELVSGYLEDAIETGKTGEVMAKQAVQGNADMIDVVTAISAAETTLETVVAVRDKVIEAYESIIRMPI